MLANIVDQPCTSELTQLVSSPEATLSNLKSFWTQLLKEFIVEMKNSADIPYVRILLPCLLTFAATAAMAATVPGTLGNGLTDDTSALQGAIDSLPSYGVLDGGGALYLTGTLKLKPRMTMQNFRLKTRASNVPFVAPVTLDGTKTPITEVKINNVQIDGNRAEQTNLQTAEDGGRDGFRIVGVARDIWIMNSSAVNCATDGLKIFSADTLPPAGALNFTNIYIINSTFKNNRRHGASADSIRNVNFINVQLVNNGLASTQAGSAKNEGASAFLVDGMLYGAGLVIEGYTAAGSVDNLNVVACTATGNARFGIQFWEGIQLTASGFSPRSNIRIESSSVDGGVSPTHGRQAIEFNTPYTNFGPVSMYRNVTLSDNRIVGTVIVNATAELRMIGGTVQSPYPGFFGLSQASRDVVIQSVESAGKLFVQR